MSTKITHYIVDPCYVLDDSQDLAARIDHEPFVRNGVEYAWGLKGVNGDGLKIIRKDGVVIGEAPVDSGDLGLFTVEALDILGAKEEAERLGVPVELTDAAATSFDALRVDGYEVLEPEQDQEEPEL